MTITLYVSVLCPRCHIAKKHLVKLLEKHPSLEMEIVDVTANPLRMWKDGIRMIPALTYNGRTLSGLWLTKSAISNFIGADPN